MMKLFFFQRKSLWIKVLTTLLLITVLWIIASYVLLNSSWLPKQLSQLQGVELSWKKGHSLHPGRWEIEGFFLSLEDDELIFSIDAERAYLEISLYRLLRGELYINSLNAQGIRRLIFNDLVIEGSGEVAIKETLLTTEQIEVTQLVVKMDKGQVTRSGDHSVLLRDITLYTDLRLDKASPMDLNIDLLDTLSGDVQLDAHADAWDVFMPYLDTLNWINLSGHGRLEAKLTLLKGNLVAASHLTLSSPELQVEIDHSLLQEHAIADSHDVVKYSIHRASGDGSVVLQVNEENPEQLTFSIALQNVTLADESPYATGAEMLLAAVLENQRLDRLETPTSTVITLSAQVVRLDMLDNYLAGILAGQSLQVRGSGEIELLLSLLGQQLDKSVLKIIAPELQVLALEYDAAGSGELNLAIDSDQFTLDLLLNDATSLHNERMLLDKAQLVILATGPIDVDDVLTMGRAEISWEQATLPDISVLQPYLELYFEQPLSLLSGRAASEGRLEVSEQNITGTLSLKADNVRTQIRDQVVESEASLFLTLNEGTLDGKRLDISGSRLSWNAVAEADEYNPMISMLNINKARFYQRNRQPAGMFSIQGSVQQLSFLNSFLPQAHGLAIQGNGSLYVTGQFEGSRFLKDSYLGIAAEQLEVSFLDYLASGHGQLSVSLDSSDTAVLSINIPEYSLLRQNEESAHLQGQYLVITTRTDHFSKVLEAPNPVYFNTRISMPNTNIPDFTRYNSYLPDNAGLTLLGGQAQLSSEFELTGLMARGKVNLKASSIKMKLLEQQIHGDLHLSLNLEEGDLLSHQFLASDSFLRLDNIQREMSDDVDWWIVLTFTDAKLGWTDHIDLSSKLLLEMRDTGLLARLFLASARDREWLGRMLDVKNIEGRADLDIKHDYIRLSDIELIGDDFTMLADLTLKESLANGALYARKGIPAVGVELIDSESSLKVVRPRFWFENWRSRH